MKHLGLDWLSGLTFPRVPYGQILIKRLYIAPDLRLPPRTRVKLEGLENFPLDRPCFLAMNHTDRFNYMPFMKELDRLGLNPLAPWVKGKYYQNRGLAWLLNKSSCIPVPSRGFILSLDFKRIMNRRPSQVEYRELRDLTDGRREVGEDPEVCRFLDSLGEPFGDYFHRLFSRVSSEVIRLNHMALDQGYYPLVFPQGTRSRRLSRGHTGLAQMALHMGLPILPVGVSGSDLVYPGNRPRAQGGRVVYRIGSLMSFEAIDDEFTPLSLRAAQQHGARFQQVVDGVMDRINELVDPDYRYSEDRESDGVQGVGRFL